MEMASDISKDPLNSIFKALAYDFLVRYKHEIRKEDQQALRKLVKIQYHYQVSPEINRELELARYLQL